MNQENKDVERVTENILKTLSVVMEKKQAISETNKLIKFYKDYAIYHKISFKDSVRIDRQDIFQEDIDTRHKVLQSFGVLG